MTLDSLVDLTALIDQIDRDTENEEAIALQASALEEDFQRQLEADEDAYIAWRKGYRIP